MPGLNGLITNLRACASSPPAWRLARQSVKVHGAIQHVDELTCFTKRLRASPPRVVLEIGTAQGGVFWLFCRVARTDATLISLDLPSTERHSGGKRMAIDLPAMKKAGQTIHVVHGDSHQASALDRVGRLLGERKLDLLFIDGDHTYGGVKSDYEMYGPLVRAGGTIAFHDIVSTPWPGCQVDRFWAEVSADASRASTTIVRTPPSHFGGIGLLTVLQAR
jgi:predicted O-methyltransferase YrrM